MNAEKLKKIGSSVRTGGKGSVRRKKLIKVASSSASSDKNLLMALKRIQLNAFDVDEVNLYHIDSKVVSFISPAVSVNIGSNVFVVKGKHTEKKITPEELSQAMKMSNADIIQRMQNADQEKVDTSDIPELVDDFEKVADENPIDAPSVENASDEEAAKSGS